MSKQQCLQRSTYIPHTFIHLCDQCLYCMVMSVSTCHMLWSKLRDQIKVSVWIPQKLKSCVSQQVSSNILCSHLNDEDLNFKVCICLSNQFHCLAFGPSLHLSRAVALKKTDIFDIVFLWFPGLLASDLLLNCTNRLKGEKVHKATHLPPLVSLSIYIYVSLRQF